MRKIYIKVFYVFVITCLLINTFTTGKLAFADIKEPNYHAVVQSREKNLTPSSPIIIKPANIKLPEDGGIKLLSKNNTKGYENEALSLPSDSELSFQVTSPKQGNYQIMMDYYIPKEIMQDSRISVLINGKYQFYESRNIKLPAIWKDKTQKYDKDSYGNESYPKPVRVFKWQDIMLNHSVYSLTTPLIFSLKSGINTITIKTNEVEILVGDIKLTTGSKINSYKEYKEKYKNKSDANTKLTTIQGEHYSEKSESYIRGEKSNEYNMYPYDTSSKLINYLSPKMWENPGESVTYDMNIEKDGLYALSLKYKQNNKKNLPAFKRIYIDGKVPFQELNSYPFNYTGPNIVNETLSINKEKVLLYLSQGKHTLTLESTADPFYDTYENLQGIINKISEISMKIKTVTGNKIDKNRTWNIIEYVPTLKDDLKECQNSLKSEYDRVVVLAGNNKVPTLSNLNSAISMLDEFITTPDKIVNNMDQFSEGSSSISQQIALLLPELLKQPMAIDQIYISDKDEKLPKEKVGFFKSISEEINKFMYSFKNSGDKAQVNEKEKINIWVNMTVPFVELLRQKVENEFTKETGIKVNISIMNNEQKLLLANSAGNAPDVVLGGSSYRPFDFALRGAIYDLRQFKDFGQYIKKYPSEMIVPFTINDSVYALPESLNFNVLFYRKDILSRLGLQVPNTWDDVVKMLPTLERYNMNFNTMIANVGALKHLGATAPFIQQHEGQIYSKDGSRVMLGDPKTVEAFKLMTDLYTRYSLPENIANFYNNFRYGVTPIGASDLNTYILLKNAAPEIAEQWGIAPNVGVKNDKGEILRYQPAVNTACFMMKETKSPDKSWEFMKWWMDTNTQTSFANDLQLRFGPEYIWTSANLQAFKQSSSFPEEDKKIILKQLEYIKEVPRNPAYFAVERELSNAWNKVMFNDKPPRIALDQAILTSNREIAKKLKEFKFMDSQGKLLKPFNLATPDKIDNWKE